MAQLLSHFRQALISRRRRWRTLGERAVVARRRADLADFLADLYPGAPLLTWAGRRYPVALFPAPADPPVAPNAALGALDLVNRAAPDRAVRRLGRSYIRRLLASGRPLANLPIFAIDRLQIDSAGVPRLDCAIGRYFDALATGSLLELELLARLPNAAARGMAGLSWDRLPLRWRAQRLAGNPLWNGAGRAAAVGISTVLAFTREDRSFAVLLKERSLRLASAVDRFHVVPSLIFQPLTGDPAQAFDVEAAVEREYLEEVLGVPEPGEGPPDAAAAGGADLAFLRHLRDRGEAELRLTGVAVDLLSLRPEICTLLLIRTPEWYRHHAGGAAGLRRLDLSPRPTWQPGQPWTERLDPLFAATLDQVVAIMRTPGAAVLPAMAALALASRSAGF
ncbi:MAG: hypothetical protein HY331_07550 [Chloroflexi bacterium]|nr:hypothetical protein [Chloroflexota bacterium]